MATQVICDACGGVIDTSQPYYQAVVTQVQVNPEGAMTVVEGAQSLDYHIEHLPRPLTPVLDDLSPASAVIDPQDYTVNVNVSGKDFMDTAKVIFDGKEMDTLFKADTQLGFTVNTQSEAPGDYDVLVRQGDRESNVLKFKIKGDEPEEPPAEGGPTVSNLNPAGVPVGSDDTPVHVFGTGFVNGVIATFGGIDQATTRYDDTHVMFVLAKDNIDEAGDFPITVRDGNKVSNSINFNVASS